MIFKVISIYRKAKQGVQDPSGLVVEEINDAFIGAAILPGILLVVVTIILGVLSFSHILARPSVIAEFFFWLFLVTTFGYVTLVVVLKKLLNKLLRAAKGKLESIQHTSSL